MKSLLQIFFIIFYDFIEIIFAKGRLSKADGSWFMYGVFFLNMPYLIDYIVDASC